METYNHVILNWHVSPDRFLKFDLWSDCPLVQITGDPNLLHQLTEDVPHASSWTSIPPDLTLQLCPQQSLLTGLQTARRFSVLVCALAAPLSSSVLKEIRARLQDSHETVWLLLVLMKPDYLTEPVQPEAFWFLWLNNRHLPVLYSLASMNTRKKIDQLPRRIEAGEFGQSTRLPAPVSFPAKAPQNYTWTKLSPRPAPIYLFTEGSRTEPAYLSWLRKLIETHPLYTGLIHIIPVGTGGRRILQYARSWLKSRNLKKGQVFLLYDKDDHSDAEFNAIVKQCQQHSNKTLSFTPIWSNEAFELWYNLHFAFYTAANSRQDYLHFLKKELKKRGAGTYQKNDGDFFWILARYGNPARALSWSERLAEEHQGRLPASSLPQTQMHVLIRALLPYLPDQIQNLFRTGRADHNAKSGRR